MKVSKGVGDYFISYFSGMCKKSEQLTPEQKLLAVK